MRKMFKPCQRGNGAIDVVIELACDDPASGLRKLTWLRSPSKL